MTCWGFTGSPGFFCGPAGFCCCLSVLHFNPDCLSQLKLWFDKVGHQLIVTVLGAKELPVRDDGRPRNPYVKIYFLPDRRLGALCFLEEPFHSLQIQPAGGTFSQRGDFVTAVTKNSIYGTNRPKIGRSGSSAGSSGPSGSD